jgi:hypothetical protein
MRMIEVLIVVALLAAAPATRAARFWIDYDKTVDFMKFDTFAWREGTPVDDDLVQSRLETAVETQLTTAGIDRAEGEPDVWVVMHASVEGGLQPETWGYAGSEWPGWGGWGTTSVNISEVDVGTWVVDIIDAATGDLVWRGIAIGSVEPEPDKRGKRIQKTAARMFRDFPPVPR